MHTWRDTAVEITQAYSFFFHFVPFFHIILKNDSKTEVDSFREGKNSEIK